jgi:pyruvate dehydrogenase E2 component (dihydrolipoamide acetyltransferase)
MAVPVEVPKLGNTVEECLIAKWRKRKGETVAAGEVVADIETDKATFEVTAPVEGTLLETYYPEGALAPVFTNMFAVGAPGEDVEAFRPKEVVEAQQSGTGASACQPAANQPQDGQAKAPAPPASEAAPAVGAYSPRARRFSAEHGFFPERVSGSGPGGRVLESDLRELYFSSAHVSSAARARMGEGAEARGEGSGAAGMVLASDLGPPAARVSRLRETIARRMRESLAQTAQYTMTASAEATGLLALRARAKTTPGAEGINVNDLVCFCVIRALLEMPQLNAEFIDGKLYQHAAVHLGFACDTDRGLLSPVVKDAHTLSIGELSSRMKALANAAIDGTIAVEDLSGATFTVSNLGNLGIESFTPLINPPQVAILGVDAIQLRPVRRGGSVEFADFIGFSITCDHQIVDGAPGARFLKLLREKIEKVETLCTI